MYCEFLGMWSAYYGAIGKGLDDLSLVRDSWVNVGWPSGRAKYGCLCSAFDTSRDVWRSSGVFVVMFLFF